MSQLSCSCRKTVASHLSLGLAVSSERNDLIKRKYHPVSDSAAYMRARLPVRADLCGNSSHFLSVIAHVSSTLNLALLSERPFRAAEEVKPQRLPCPFSPSLSRSLLPPRESTVQSFRIHSLSDFNLALSSVLAPSGVQL